MFYRRTAIFLAAGWAISILAAAQAPAPYKAPRTVDGKPDLQGIWMTRNAASADARQAGGRPVENMSVRAEVAR